MPEYSFETEDVRLKLKGGAEVWGNSFISWRDLKEAEAKSTKLVEVIREKDITASGESTLGGGDADESDDEIEEAGVDADGEKRQVRYLPYRIEGLFEYEAVMRWLTDSDTDWNVTQKRKLVHRTREAINRTIHPRDLQRLSDELLPKLFPELTGVNPEDEGIEGNANGSTAEKSESASSEKAGSGPGRKIKT